MSHEKLVVIGAPRSGTNMLRDLLCSFNNVSTWPCDEINYIWRHGNVGYPTDAFPKELARPKVVNYIRSKFDWVASKYSANFVVEKTCANCLRVPFVNRVVPDARYIYIYRNGLDAVGSANVRWKAELDFRYIFRKCRFVPLVDLPVYAARYLCSHMYRLFSNERRVSFWGPVFDGLVEAKKEHDLNVVCAMQWKACVEAAESALNDLEESRVCKVSYEKFVRDPVNELERVLRFSGVKYTKDELIEAVSSVSEKSVGKGRKSLGTAECDRLMLVVGELLDRHE